MSFGAIFLASMISAVFVILDFGATGFERPQNPVVLLIVVAFIYFVFWRIEAMNRAKAQPVAPARVRIPVPRPKVVQTPQLVPPQSKPKVERNLVLYHGTPDVACALNAIEEGFRSGPRNQYGYGAYFTSKFHGALHYSKNTGVIVCLKVSGPVRVMEWFDVPGSNEQTKHNWCLVWNIDFVTVKKNGWYIAHTRFEGERVAIPGVVSYSILNRLGQKVG